MDLGTTDAGWPLGGKSDQINKSRGHLKHAIFQLADFRVCVHAPNVSFRHLPRRMRPDFVGRDIFSFECAGRISSAGRRVYAVCEATDDPSLLICL